MRQEKTMSLEWAAKEFLRGMSVIWSSPLSDHNRVTASNQIFITSVRLPNVDAAMATTELKGYIEKLAR